MEDRYAQFPPGFFDRIDATDDAVFYAPDRMVTHIDEGAITAVGSLYAELGVDGRVLDLMSSWISHFTRPPRELTVLGMNQQELDANPAATHRVVRNLNAAPELPFGDGSFDDVVCAVSVDYLVRPLEVFDEVARVLRPDGRFVCTFSNRCFPTKAIQGWLATDDRGHAAIVGAYFELTPGFGEVEARLCTESGTGDPLLAVWAPRGSPTVSQSIGTL